MISILSNKNRLKVVVVLLTLILPVCSLAAQDEYSSVLVNESKNANSIGFTLIKTRVWPDSTPSCLIDSGKQVLSPGESTLLKIKKNKECNQAGIGYSIYRVDDNKHQHLLGYLSHRFANGKFSMQISRFCEGDKCIFKDLHPEQNRHY